MRTPPNLRESVSRTSHRTRGAARPAFLAALGACVALLGAGLFLLATTGGAPGPDDPDVVDPDGEVEVPSGAPDPSRRRTRTPRGATQTDDGDDSEAEWIPPGGRDPEGDLFVVDAASLRSVLAERHWEEVRRQIDVLQSEGTPLPDDVVRALLAMLADEGLRMDAMLALGGVSDAAAGRLLAEIAADAGATEETRIAALGALAKSGQSAGVDVVRGLVEGDGGDTPVVRHALAALAAMGGSNGVRPLLDFLSRHSDDDLTDVTLSALSRAKGADPLLAQEVRAAREASDPVRLMLLLRVGTQLRADAGAELRAEVRRIVEAPDQLESSIPDEEARLRLVGAAIGVAAAMGGEELAAVVRVARDRTGTSRDMALYALRSARGDDAAQSISTLLTGSLESRARREVVLALGMTESRKATPALHAALDDPDAEIRRAAAAGLGSVRDPASVPVILARLDAAKGDHVLAQNYVKALGTIGVRDALQPLRDLLDRDDPFWRLLDPYVKNAIVRIDTGNPDSKRIR